MMNTDKNGKFVGDIYQGNFSYDCGFALVNNDSDIFIFDYKYGRIFKMNMNTNEMRCLVDIKCPSLTWGWHAVFCRQSKNVHLFSQTLRHHVQIGLSALNTSRSDVQVK